MRAAPQPATRRQMAVVAQAILALILISTAVLPPLLGLLERNLQLHHLQHAALVAGGGFLGLVLVGLDHEQPAGQTFPWQRWRRLPPVAWAVLVVGPVLVMAAMIPATSPQIDDNLPLHSLVHLVFIACGVAIALAGRVFAPAVAWLVTGLTVVMMAMFGAMALPHPLNPTISVSGPPAAGSTAPGASGAAARGSAAAGRAAFLSAGCMGCHTLATVGATGAVGPALTHEGTRRNLAWLVVQMHTPCASGHSVPGYSCQMMTSAVAGLTEQQRRDLAAFLATQ